MKYFTQYWRNDTCDEFVLRRLEGQILDHTAGNRLLGRLSPGDLIYVNTIRLGRLFFIGRMEIAECCSMARARRVLNTHDLWPADDHFIAKRGTAMHFWRIVPMAITRALRFQNGQRLLFQSPGVLDKQTLRCVRELSLPSAKLLDQLL